MALPVTPLQLRLLVPSENDSICDVLRKTFQFQIAYWQIYKYWFNDDGKFTPEFIAEICEAASRPVTAL